MITSFPEANNFIPAIFISLGVIYTTVFLYLGLTHTLCVRAYINIHTCTAHMYQNHTQTYMKLPHIPINQQPQTCMRERQTYILFGGPL